MKIESRVRKLSHRKQKRRKSRGGDSFDTNSSDEEVASYRKGAVSLNQNLIVFSVSDDSHNSLGLKPSTMDGLQADEEQVCNFSSCIQHNIHNIIYYIKMHRWKQGKPSY